MSRLYTQETDDTIARMWNEGKSLAAISKVTGRSEKTLSKRRGDLGLDPRNQPIVLTDRQEERLRVFCQENAPYNEIVAELGVSKCAIQRIMREKGISKISRDVARRVEWTPALDDIIITAVKDGLNTTEIARRTGMSHNTADGRIRYLKTIGRITEPVDEPTPQVRKDCIAAEVARISDDYTARMRGLS